MIKAGILNQPLMKDAPYYIDIFKFKETGIYEFKDSYSNFLSHFKKFFHLVKASKNNGLLSLSSHQVQQTSNKVLRKILKSADFQFQGAFNQLSFQEIDGFNIGYSKSLRGASIGPKFKLLLIKAAQELLTIQIDDPEIFCLLPFLQEGIGCDRISDMFIAINYIHFLKFTERKLGELCITTSEFEIEDQKFKLIKPSAFKNPLVLIPKSFLKPLPSHFNWSDILTTYDENSALRSRLNSLILKHIDDKKDITKAKVASILKGDPSLLKQIVQEFKETTTFSQIEKDILEQIENELDLIEIPDTQTLKDQVRFILNKFKWFVERKGTWRLFYSWIKNESGTKVKHPLSEDHIQKVFQIVAELLADKIGIEVTPESETGVGPVDFKFSRNREKVLVEVKLSTHRNVIHGFETQLEEYIKSESPEFSFYLIVVVANSDSYAMDRDERRLKKLDIAREDSVINYKEVFTVDAKPKTSASKA